MAKGASISGFPEWLPSERVVEQRVIDTLRRVFELNGFIGVETRAVEQGSSLLKKGETSKEIYLLSRLQEVGHESDTPVNDRLGLHFDLTVPLSRYVVEHSGDLAFPFKRWQIQKVWRGERPQEGRFREFVQADIDVIGNGDLPDHYEVELPLVMVSALEELRAFGLPKATVHANNRKLSEGFYRGLGLTDIEGVLREIDKLDKIGPEKVGDILTQDCGLTREQAEEILRFISIGGGNAQVVAALEQYAGRSELFDTGLAELKAVTANLAAFGVPEENFAVDLTIARGLDYYTGTVYETTLLDHPEIGSVCSGGRYDNLAGYYIDKPLPGVGISIGLTRLFYVLDEQGLLNPALPSAPADALVLPMTADMAPAIALAETLRSAGLRVQLYGEQKKFKQKMAYANKLGVPYAVLLGEDEIEKGLCSVKNMQSGEETEIRLDEISESLMNIINSAALDELAESIL
mgnify:CR=1 FL=1